MQQNVKYVTQIQATKSAAGCMPTAPATSTTACTNTMGLLQSAGYGRTSYEAACATGVAQYVDHVI